MRDPFLPLPVDDEETPGGEGPEAVNLDCPTCDEVQAHAILRAADAGFTVQCDVCHTVRTLPAPPKERLVTVPLVLSQGAESRKMRLSVPLEGMVAIDDEYDLDGMRIRVTGIEAADGTLPKRTLGRNVRILHAVKFDTVTLYYSINLGDVTRSFQEEVIPEEIVEVGIVREVQGMRLVVKTIKSDENRTLHRGLLPARHVRRVFADLAPKKVKVGERVEVRRRGDPKKAARVTAARRKVEGPGAKRSYRYEQPPRAPRKSAKAAKPKAAARRDGPASPKARKTGQGIGRKPRRNG